jgi:hypothetical protein
VLDTVRDELPRALQAAGLPSITASFGVVDRGPGEDLTAALARADAALFQAKRDGRDRIVLHDRSGATVPAEQQVDQQVDQQGERPHQPPFDPPAEGPARVDPLRALG